jgi:hypothetical protein
VNWHLVLCALGWHRWRLYYRSSAAEADTHRECDYCITVQRRDTRADPWKTLA